MDTEALQSTVIDCLDDLKGRDITCLDVRKLTDIADYMIIASGTSKRHVSALAEKVIEKTKSLKNPPLGSEGVDQGEWALIDLGDIIVHVMLPDVRELYSLEKLWAPDLQTASQQ